MSNSTAGGIIQTYPSASGRFVNEYNIKYVSMNEPIVTNSGEDYSAEFGIGFSSKLLALGLLIKLVI